MRNLFGKRARRVLIAAAVGGSVIGSAALLGGCRSKRPIRVEPGDLRAAVKLAERGERYAAEEDYLQAERYYAASLRADPNQHGVWNNLGVIYMQRENLFDAARAFRQAAAIEPRESRPHANLGKLWLKVDARQAVKHFEHALDVDPGSLDAMRGVIQSRKRANTKASSATLDLITTALLYETDPEWRTFFEQERARLESEIAAERDRFDAEAV